MPDALVLAIDQGTTGTACIVFDGELQRRGRGYAEVAQHFPRPAWVEHDPEEIWISVLTAAEAALAEAGVRPGDLAAIGITNQRETTVLWERSTGRPVHRAIVWQDRRTAWRCEELPRDLIRERTGLVPDPYFSATKLEWLLGETDVNPADLAFGTVDSWLLWQLTGGAVHATDVSNAVCTMLLGLESLEWDDELLELFGVPREILPEVVDSSGPIAEAELFGARVPVAGMVGDQQAALFGQGCHQPGQVKATYGTGSFVLANTGSDAGPASEGLLRMAAWRLQDEQAVYALEGAIFVTGAAIQWLRDGLGLLGDAAESEELARTLEGNEGVYFVPALTGLGSPHWAPEARGLIMGLTRGTNRAHLVRAALEAAAYQTTDVLDAMATGVELLRVDGGMTANAFLMQLQADLARIPVEVPAERESTALGAAALAGLGAGVWKTPAEIAALGRIDRRYEPELPEDEAERLLAGWREALARTLL